MPGSTTWTTPITWGTADPTVSQFNQQIRDNENHLYERAAAYSVYKSADESLNTNTTLQNDNALLWAVNANEVWNFELGVFVNDASAGAADFKMGWSVPTSATMKWSTYFAPSGAVPGVQPVITTQAPVAVYTESSTPAFGAANVSFLMKFTGNVFVSSNAGTVNLQWAQNTSNGSNLTVQTGSYLFLTKLA